MDISQFTIEDFVYDPEFRKWVLYADFDSIKFYGEGIFVGKSFPKKLHHAG